MISVFWLECEKKKITCFHTHSDSMYENEIESHSYKMHDNGRKKEEENENEKKREME